MLIKIDVYVIDHPDLKRVASILENKFNIEFESQNDSEMSEAYFEYESNPDLDGDQLWSLYRLEEEDGVERLPIKLRVQDAPEMDDVKRKLDEIEDFVVVLESRRVFDNEIDEAI